MKSFVRVFEIPATKIARAVDFYQATFDIAIEIMSFDGMQMGVFPSEGQMNFGVIIEGEGYKPSKNGVTLYLDAGNDLQIILDKIKAQGGKIVVAKTPHADESGYFALFIDSEGNKMGLHSEN